MSSTLLAFNFFELRRFTFAFDFSKLKRRKLCKRCRMRLFFSITLSLLYIRFERRDNAFAEFFLLYFIGDLYYKSKTSKDNRSVRSHVFESLIFFHSSPHKDQIRSLEVT